MGLKIMMDGYIALPYYFAHKLSTLDTLAW